MKKLFLIFSLAIAFIFVSNVNAQTPITFAKGQMKKTMTVTLKAGASSKYVITVKKNQVINVTTSGNTGIEPNKDSFSVVNPSIYYKENVDQTQDGEGYFSIYTGRSGKYIITVRNGAKQSRTFKLTVEVSNNKEDFQGGVIE
ncbi:MAG: hypothetical protein MUC29_13205 [Pyrinomonadaceae bacterium]|nr:hypothetical protein [Pyrinomonadaceae bacterium]